MGVEERNYTGDDILTLLPHREPFVMVDTFLGIDDKGVSVAELTIGKDNLFVDARGEFTEPGIIEHMAQSAAARMGYLSLQSEGEVYVGYIGSVDKFNLVELPKVGATLRTEVEVLQEVFDVTLVRVNTFDNGREIASCNLKVYLNRDEKAEK